MPTTIEIHDELAAFQDCRLSAVDSAREHWRTMYRRARVELRQPWFGRTETAGSTVGELAHDLLAARGRLPADHTPGRRYLPDAGDIDTLILCET